MRKEQAIFLLILIILVSSYAMAEEPALFLFGGKQHDKFLGCLNCSKVDELSVWNKFGKYGSKFSSDSIWNQFGPYGSKFNSLSPWNKFSSDGPVIVDSGGGFYGYFTLNTFNNQTKIELFVWLLNNHEYIIENFDEISNKF